MTSEASGPQAPPQAAEARGGARRLVLRALSWLAVAASFAFLASALVSVGGSEIAGALTPGFAVLLLLLSAAYALTLLLVAAAWGLVLKAFVGRGVTFVRVIGVYGKSQIAKYAPGNVFHLLGRQVLGRRFGWSQAAMAAATLAETGLIALAALGLALILGGARVAAVLQLSPLRFGLSAGVAIALGGLALLAAWRVKALRSRLETILRAGRAAVPSFLAAYLLYAAFFIATSALFAALLFNGESEWRPLYAEVLFAFSAAWLAGYMIPGAPGGLGVREAILVLLLTNQFSEAGVLVAALGMRVVTILGDALHFILASLIARRAEPS